MILSAYSAFTISEFHYFFQRKTFLPRENYEQNPLGIDSNNKFLSASKDITFPITALRREISEKIHNEDVSFLDYIQLGRTFSDAFQDEVAFQLYYLAYLKNREVLNTNSELQLE